MPEIKNYAVRVHGGPKGEGTGIRAQIHLFDGNSRMAGFLNFYDESAPLPEDHEIESGQIVLSLHISLLQSTVDILRNEEPIYLYWQKSLSNGYLGTGQEPVGEGE